MTSIYELEMVAQTVYEQMRGFISFIAIQDQNTPMYEAGSTFIDLSKKTKTLKDVKSAPN